MNVSPARLALPAVASVVVGLLLAAFPAAAQASFDSQPTGFLTATTGGFPATAWNGTSMATAKSLVSALPAAPRSRALRDLQFKVLVSALNPPRPDGGPPPSLFARRVDKIAAMGESESLNEMVRNANGYADPAVAATTVNALLMAGARDSGCTIVRSFPLAEPFGARAQAACRLAAGDMAGAVEAAATARAGDPGFAKLVDAVATGQPAAGATPGTFDGPAMVVMDLAHVPPPATALRSTQPLVIRALVGLRSLPLATRVDIAERGEALAVIEASRLGDLYAEALRDGASLPAATVRRARLVTAAKSASNEAEVMRTIADVYAESRGSPLFPTVARASAIGLVNLPANPKYATVAVQAMRGFLLLGDKARTQAWTRLALDAARNNARAQLAIDRQMPLVALAGLDNPQALPITEFDRWYEMFKEEDAGRAGLRAYVLLELLRATGLDIPRGATSLPEQAPGGARLVMPNGATLQSLAASAAGGRIAETALLAPIAAGEIALNELHPAGAAAIVRALRQIGEDETARLFAVEVAIAYGI
ncbi:MAG: hypothetical protein LCH95_15680 [Proteobacteria bacterium]|nr:hypothetical protein [Pseudomonadota bacterium]